MQFRISPCKPEPFKDCTPLKMCQSLWQKFFLGSLQEGRIRFMLLCIKNEQYDVIFTVMMS